MKSLQKSEMIKRDQVLVSAQKSPHVCSTSIDQVGSCSSGERCFGRIDIALGGAALLFISGESMRLQFSFKADNVERFLGSSLLVLNHGISSRRRFDDYAYEV